MVRSFVAAGRLRTELFRPYGRPSDSFSSLWAAVTLTVHINALYCKMKGYMESKNRQLELIRFR